MFPTSHPKKTKFKKAKKLDVKERTNSHPKGIIIIIIIKVLFGNQIRVTIVWEHRLRSPQIPCSNEVDVS